jgi:DNA polymerase-2
MTKEANIQTQYAPKQQAFLLTRHLNDRHSNDLQRNGHNNSKASPNQNDTILSYWAWTPQGIVKLNIEQQKPHFFIEQQDHSKAISLFNKLNLTFEDKFLELTTFENRPTVVFYFSRLATKNKAVQALMSADIITFESDIRLQDRYLIERNIQANFDFIGMPQSRQGFTEYHQVKLKSVEHHADKLHPDFKVVSLDIECSMQGELFSIGLHSYGSSKKPHSQTESSETLTEPLNLVIMIGAPDQANSTTDDPELQAKVDAMEIQWVKDEYQLLMALEHHIQLFDPDIIIGWNVINFDFQLLIKRAKKLNLTLRLGRELSSIHWRDSRTENNQGFVTLPGRLVIDGIDSLKTATYHFESFSLENVSRTLLQRGKDTEDVENRVEHILHDFEHNKLKLAAYNLEDCRLVSDIFDHTQLLDFMILRSQITGLELDKVGGSVAAFTNLYLPKLHRAGYIAPNLPPDGGLASPGGYVMNSLPGFYKNVLVLDFKSLYPSIIRTFKIDPMGLIEGLKHPDNAIPGFKGGWFDRDKHFLPDIITSLWQQRDQAKRDQDAPRSQAIKIIMNSFYGVLGSGGCRFYDTRLASSITMRGHQIMTQTAEWIEQQSYQGRNHQVIYGDTDSTFVLLDESLSQQEAKAIGHSLATYINQQWRDYLKSHFNLSCHLEIEFENHYSRFLMPTIRGSEAGSKKRYAGLIKENDQERMVYKGLETVRTDWTELAREFQHELYQKVFHDCPEPELIAFIKHRVTQVSEGLLDHKLIYRKRLRRPLREYVKNIPPHVKAARKADEINQAKGLPLQYQYKGWISYLITIGGAEPEEYLASPIDYNHYIEKQLQPIAEGILPMIGLDFGRILDQQMDLF